MKIDGNQEVPVYLDTAPRESLEKLLVQAGAGKVFCVCDNAFPLLGLEAPLEELSFSVTYYNSVGVNPVYEDVLKGVQAFIASGAQVILAIGGGSTLDTAKGIAYFSSRPPQEHFLPAPEDLPDLPPVIAVPATAGTGSEATHFAVVYKDGVKHSVAHPGLLARGVYLRSTLLKTLPDYQKRCTVFDALSQAIESWWSCRSTEESRRWSRAALENLWPRIRAYCRHEESTFPFIMEGAHFAGRAINLAQTTAAHAMSYKLTSLYGLPHGHAVAVCLVPLWRFMIQHPEYCRDPRGIDYVHRVFGEIAEVLGQSSTITALEELSVLIQDLGLLPPKEAVEGDLPRLLSSVNPQRMANNPWEMSPKALELCYREALDV